MAIQKVRLIEFLLVNYFFNAGIVKFASDLFKNLNIGRRNVGIVGKYLFFN